MKVLDADDKPLISTNGKQMSRDIVQFVPFKSCNNSPIALAKEVLEEIPGQVTSYFQSKGIVPNPPVPVGAQ